MKVQSILIVALGLVFSVCAAIAVKLYVQRMSGPEPIATVPVVVATMDVPRGATISSEQVEVKSWPKELAPPFVVQKVEDAVGKAVVDAFVRGEPVMTNKVASQEAGRGLSALVPPGMRAFTIHTPQIASRVAGFILPGNKVDVLFTISAPDAETGGAVTTTLLQNVEILAVDQQLHPPSENRIDYNLLQSVTLLVTPDEAAKLDLAQNRGTLHLTLRNAQDTSPAQTHRATLAQLQTLQERRTGEFGLAGEGKAEGPKVAPPPPPPPPPESAPAPPLEIRTMRGVYEGVVSIEQRRPAK